MKTRLFVVPKNGQAPQRRNATSVVLTLEQRILLHRLQINRMVEGRGKPTITEMVSEGLALLFARERI
jgi:hypothetical protein